MRPGASLPHDGPVVDPEYDRLLAVLKHPKSAVPAAWRVGSRVYGTASPDSDHDYVVVLSSPAQKQDLLFGEDINVVLHGTFALNYSAHSR